MTTSMAGSDKGKKGATPEPRRALGRGLDALLPSATANAAQRVDSEYQRVGVERIRPQKGQPRKHFDDAALEELASSIRQQGILQPIVVRKAPGNEFEIIAGERRWRAAQKAGLREVAVVIKDVAPGAAFELALIENVQRMDLDAIETAEAYQRLIDEHGYTQESLATRVGKNRATVTNTLRLLGLPAEVRARVVTGELSEGHARALLSSRDAGEMARLAREAVEKKWSVRETEAATRKGGAKKPGGAADARPAEPPAIAKSANVRHVEKQIEAALGMAVAIREDADKKSGLVEIAFDNLDQLDRLLAKLLGH